MKFKRESVRNYFKVYKKALGLLWDVSPALVSVQLVFFLLQSLVPVVILASTKKLFDLILAEVRSFDDILFWLLILGGLQVLLVFLSQFSNFFSEIYQEKLTDTVNSLILEKSIEIPYPFFEDPAYYDSLHLAQRQSIYKLPLLFQQVQGTLSNFLSLSLLITYFFSLISGYAWVILLIALPLGIVKWFSGFALHRLEFRIIPMEREASYYHYILTNESYAHEIRTLNFGESLLQRFRDLRGVIYQKKKNLRKKLLTFSLLAELLEVGVLFFILISVARKAFEGLLGVSLLIVYLQGIQRMQSNLKNFLNSLVQLIQLRIFLTDIFKFLDLADHSFSRQGNKKFPETDFSIKVDNVSYRYPGVKKYALDSISMKFEVGKVVGIVGANGSGKSTLVKLLAGLYIPSSGKISLGNQLIGEINQQSFRDQTLFFFQDFQRYFFSVEDVISLGAEKNPNHDQQLQIALDKSFSSDFVSRFPEGVRSKLGRIFDEGKGLSGGQWQKLALARTFYRNPNIVVLDEPTSALDAISERLVFDQLKKESAEKITVLITHRLYNLKDVDFIYVMDEGMISQEGTFSELIQKPGIFQNLYRQQGFETGRE